MPKKNLLVYSFSFYPFENAISNAIMPAITALREDYNVSIYTINHDRKHLKHEIHDNMHIYRDYSMHYRWRSLPYVFYRFLYEVSRFDEEACTSNNFVKSIKRFIASFFRGKTEYLLKKRDKLQKLTFPSFNKIFKKGNYDAILAILSPFSVSAEIMEFAKNKYLKENNIKWISYFVDPYSTFIGHLNTDKYAKMLADELEVYKYSDAVITTPEIYEDNKNYPLAEYTYKTTPVQLATFKQITRSNRKPMFSKKYINCVFCGSLFTLVVRNPEYFYKLVNSLPDNFRVHFVCYQSCEEADRLKEKCLATCKNVIWYDKLPIQKCFDMFMDADALVNLGNECSNQTPSKVFDYLGCAKPIINFYSIDNDTSKKYLKRYPYKLNIKNKPELDTADVDAFVDFCNKNLNTEITFDFVEKLYSDFESKKIGNQVKKIVNNICKED